MFTYEFRVNGVLTDVAALLLSDPTGTYGLRRSDTAEVLVPNDTPWSHVSTGVYQYDPASLNLANNVLYDYWAEALYDGEYTRLQRFVRGTTELTSRAIRFAVVKNLEYKATDVAPVFASPTGGFGVARVDTNEVIVAANTPFFASGILYGASFGEPSSGLKYRYYIKATLDGIVYYIPRTTITSNSAGLAVGRYTDSTLVELMYGADNVLQWLATDKGDQAIDFVMREAQFIDEAEYQIDAGLGNSYYSGDGLVGDFAGGIPRLIKSLATMLAGVLVYEARGVVDYDPKTNQAQHRLRWHRNKVEKTLTQLRNGVIRLKAGVSQPNYPSAYVSDGIEDLRDLGTVDPFSIFDS